MSQHDPGGAGPPPDGAAPPAAVPSSPDAGDAAAAPGARPAPAAGGIRRFVEDYRRLRLAEGYASTDPGFVRGLPFRDTTGRNPGVWRIRAAHYALLRACLALLPRSERVLDLGAGNGWLARRLAGTHRVTALDLDASDTGLGAIDDPRVHRVCGELEALPLQDGSFDVVIAAASLHYATRLPRALAEIARVLRGGGAFLLADSPVYADALARHQAWQRTLRYYGEAGAPHLAQRYRGLTRAELEGSGLFQFTTLSPGIAPWRALRRDAGPRMPVLLGRKR
jgi:SAM-dependent methyltransferase